MEIKAEPIKIIARYVNGRIIKGWTHDFSPVKPFFHIRPVTSGSETERVKVFLEELKALFFVKDFEGNPAYDEQKDFVMEKGPHGRRIEVSFKDGEVLVGTTTGYDPNRQGFFLFPADAMSNNLRIYVVTAAVGKVRRLPDK